MDSLTEQGIAAVKAGDIQLGNRLLRQALEQDSNDLQAWLWLSSAVDTDLERMICMENVLRIQPGHTLAKAALSKLRLTNPTPTPEGLMNPAPAAPARLNKIIKQSGELHLPGTPAYQPPTPAPPQAEPVSPAAQPPEILADDPYRKTPKTHLPLWLWLIGIVLVGCLAVFFFLGFRYYSGFRRQVASQSNSIQLTLTQVINSASATATSTDTPTVTPTATITPTPTIQPTSTLTPTPSLAPPGSAAAAAMKSIQQQVSGLRGLPVTAAVPSFVIAKERAVKLLGDDLINPDSFAALQDQKQALVTVGLLLPDYNLENHAFNRLVDGANGIYLPWDKQILIVGAQFGDIESYSYAREFDQALLDQNFDLAKMGVTKDCIDQDERCQADQALISGDGLLLQSQWLKQFAGPLNFKTLANYKPPLQFLVDQNPPAYVSQDLDFAGQFGRAFVTTLYNEGNWAQVNQAYQNPPQTTEQIMHPDKYLSGEGAVLLNYPPLEKFMSADWKLIRSQSFGEWNTLLLLGYGADVASQIDPKTAQIAAAGWGGDHYQVLYNAAIDKTALAAKWVWDTPQDAVEFQQAMQTHLSKLYRGSQLTGSTGDCWQVNNQAACLYAIPGQTLWLQGPDTHTLDAMLAQFPAFNQNPVVETAQP